ncbi:MAG TPA: pilin [Candidatus Saccharimonadales bacterium]|nr:pilin [Candidatus Saccharimonadales bacterium]
MINSIITYFAAQPLQLGRPCAFTKSAFLNFPYWYQYLHGKAALQNPMAPMSSSNQLVCTDPGLSGLNDVWLIVAAIIEILLRIATLAAIGVIIYAAIRYITSQGDTEDTKKSRSTIINALVGLLLAVTAATIVNFVARSIHN